MCGRFHYMHKVRHRKTDLKVFVIVIPKEGWARSGWEGSGIAAMREEVYSGLSDKM